MIYEGGVEVTIKIYLKDGTIEEYPNAHMTSGIWRRIMSLNNSNFTSIQGEINE
jgi:hypothetical protein